MLCYGVMLLAGCCDPFNDKALRASRGAAFKLPIGSGDWEARPHCYSTCIVNGTRFSRSLHKMTSIQDLFFGLNAGPG